MKAILISINPKWVAKILNGKKTIEIRKKFPKDYVGWVYIYCTKEQGLARLNNGSWNDTFIAEKEITKDNFKHIYSGYDGKGKVVARFLCDKVEEHRPFFHWCIEKETCLTRDDVLDYLDSKNKFVGNPKRQDKVYAVHITKLEIFNKPKEISDFYGTKQYFVGCGNAIDNTPRYAQLHSAPQSWCYIEI